MRIKREGYTFGSGALLGLMASNRPLYVFAAGLAAGLLLGGGIYAWRQLLEAARVMSRKLTSRHEPGLSAEPRPVYTGRDEIPY